MSFVKYFVSIVVKTKKMNLKKTLIPILALALAGCDTPEKATEKPSEFAAVSQVETGTPVNVMLTAYSTTLLADGLDNALLRVAVTDSLGREITSAERGIELEGEPPTHIVRVPLKLSVSGRRTATRRDTSRQVPTS